MPADSRLASSPGAAPISRASSGRLLFTSAALLLVSFVGADCTPTAAESGAAVLLVSPAVFLGALFLLWLLRLAWRPLVEARPFEPRPALATLFVLLLLSTLGVVGSDKGREWALVALIVFGTSYVSVLLLVWRIWFYKKSQTAFTWAPIATMAVMLLPAPLFVLLDPDRAAGDPVVSVLWVAPGIFGYVTIPLLVLAFGEIMIRRLLRKEPPPGAPAEES